MSLFLGLMLSMMGFMVGMGLFIGAPWLFGPGLAALVALLTGGSLAAVGVAAGLQMTAVLGMAAGGALLVVGVAAYTGYVTDGNRLERMIANTYWGLSQIGFGRAKLAKPLDSSSVSLVATSFDSEKGADKVPLGEITGYFRDVADRARYMMNRSFAIVDEWHTAVIDPVLCDMGAKRADYVEGSRDLVDTEQLEGTDTYTAATDKDDSIAIGDQLLLDSTPSMVDLSASRYLITEGAEPGDTETVEKQAKLSQMGFKESNTVEIMVYAGIFITVLGAIWLFSEGLSGSGGGNGGGSTIGMLLPLFWRVRGELR